MVQLLTNEDAQIEFLLNSVLGAAGGKKSNNFWEDLRRAKTHGPGYMGKNGDKTFLNKNMSEYVYFKIN